MARGRPIEQVRDKTRPGAGSIGCRPETRAGCRVHAVAQADRPRQHEASQGAHRGLHEFGARLWLWRSEYALADRDADMLMLIERAEGMRHWLEVAG